RGALGRPDGALAGVGVPGVRAVVVGGGRAGAALGTGLGGARAPGEEAGAQRGRDERGGGPGGAGGGGSESCVHETAFHGRRSPATHWGGLRRSSDRK